MKTKNLILASILLVGLHAQADRAGAGGDAETSNIKNVKQMIENDLENHIRFFVSEANLNRTEDRAKIQDPEVRQALEKVMTEPTWQLETTMVFKGIVDSQPLRLVKIDVKTDGPCQVDGKTSDASTGYKVGAPLCMSAWALSRYPKAALENELTALLFHELTHQVGYQERIAVKVQNFIRQKMEIAGILKQIKDAESFAYSNEVNSHACFHIGVLAGVVSTLPATRLPSLNEFTADEAKLMNEMYHMADQLQKENTSAHDQFWKPSHFISKSVSSLCSSSEYFDNKRTIEHTQVVIKFLRLYAQDIQ